MSDLSISREEHAALMAATMTEKQLQDCIIGSARRLGWLIYHTYDSRRSAPGFPDLYLVHPTHHRVLVRELKTEKGRLTLEQRRWIDALHDAGVDVDVWRPHHWYDTTITDALYPTGEASPW